MPLVSTASADPDFVPGSACRVLLLQQCRADLVVDSFDERQIVGNFRIGLGVGAVDFPARGLQVAAAVRHLGFGFDLENVAYRQDLAFEHRLGRCAGFVDRDGFIPAKERPVVAVRSRTFEAPRKIAPVFDRANDPEVVARRRAALVEDVALDAAFRIFVEENPGVFVGSGDKTRKKKGANEKSFGLRHGGSRVVDGAEIGAD